MTTTATNKPLGEMTAAELVEAYREALTAVESEAVASRTEIWASQDHIMIRHAVVWPDGIITTRHTPDPYTRQQIEGRIAGLRDRGQGGEGGRG